MSPSPSRSPLRRSTALRAAAAVAGLACGILGAEATFGRLRPAEAEATGVQSRQPVLYSVEVRTSAGQLLASPVVVRPEGEPFHLELARLVGPRSEPVELSLDLDPRSSADGSNLCLGYRLSVSQSDAQGEARGSIGLPYGERRSVRLPGSAGRLQLSVVVARPNVRSSDARPRRARSCA